MIERTMEDGIRVLTLAHGKANALDVELLEAVTQALAEEAAGPAGGVVLTGRGRSFCAGVDLRRLLADGKDYLARFLPALTTCFEALVRFPKPLVAAANGHAIAGGFVFLCAADRCLAAKGAARFGLTELPVGVPFPGIAFEIVRGRVPPERLRTLIYQGATFGVDEAVTLGIVEDLCDPRLLVREAVGAARELARIPAATFAHTRRQFGLPILAAAAAHPDVEALWRSDAVRDAIAGFVDRTLGAP